jgi:hypothetical protein
MIQEIENLCIENNIKYTKNMTPYDNNLKFEISNNKTNLVDSLLSQSTSCYATTKIGLFNKTYDIFENQGLKRNYVQELQGLQECVAFKFYYHKTLAYVNIGLAFRSCSIVAMIMGGLAFVINNNYVSKDMNIIMSILIMIFCIEIAYLLTFIMIYSLLSHYSKLKKIL